MHRALTCSIALLCACGAIVSASVPDLRVVKRVLWSSDYETWVQPLTDSGRRELFGMQSPDDKCLEACPDMKGAQTSLGLSMFSMMDKYQTPDGQMDPDRTGEFMGEMVAALIDNMCRNKAAYKCVATHSDCKAEENTNSNSNCECNSNAQSGSNSTQSSGSSCNCQQQQSQTNQISIGPSPEMFQDSLECFCDACPELGCALGTYMGEFFGALASAFSSISSPAPSTDHEELTKKMTAAACSLIDPMKCAASNPDKCKAFVQDEGNKQMEEEIAKVTDTCLAENIPTGPAQCSINVNEDDNKGEAGKQGSHAVVLVIASILAVMKFSM